MKTIIKQYIQFAIDNGYENNILLGVVNEKNIEDGKEYKVISNFTAEITSKPFIEAIAKGCKYVDLNKFTNKDMYGWSDCEKITFLQSSAIRDVKLEEFITNLGILGKQENN